MAPPTNLNLATLRGRTFQGFIQFQEPDSGTWYRLKERQNMSLTIKYGKIGHYTDVGELSLDPTGIQHSFNMTIKVTKDMFDVTPTDTDSDQKTISYWIAKGNAYEPFEIVFVSSMEMLDGNFINIKFKLDPDTFQPSLGKQGGSPEITVSGIVTEVVEALFAGTGDQ